MQDPAAIEPPEEEGQPAGLTLEKLNFAFKENLYYAAPGQELFRWGSEGMRNRLYENLDAVRGELSLEQGSMVSALPFANIAARDFRLPEASELARQCYPQGDVPGVRLGVDHPSQER